LLEIPNIPRHARKSCGHEIAEIGARNETVAETYNVSPQNAERFDAKLGSSAAASIKFIASAVI
jgi:hypothetical protein